MFALKSTVKMLEERYAALARQHTELLTQWNALVTKINKRGGQTFLDASTKQLTNDDIKKLLMLCHPDKHGGKKMAEEMTAKLLAMRE